eukprot:1158407-Pelagomonas_calceolata.AAC.9
MALMPPWAHMGEGCCPLLHLYAVQLHYRKCRQNNQTLCFTGHATGISGGGLLPSVAAAMPGSPACVQCARGQTAGADFDRAAVSDGESRTDCRPSMRAMRMRTDCRSRRRQGSNE